MTWHVQKLTDAGKLSLLQEMYREWPFMQVPLIHHMHLFPTWYCVSCDWRHAISRHEA
jgi:hypothetical protein